ncbi:LPXTG cell wall anchor domain-containing protein [Streptococcus suis]|nr:LPXTG cell wall anchor domain-containing protein [Streptococcus suis]
MSCLVAFHYRSYGTFFLYSKRLHNLHGGFTHYRNYRAKLYQLPSTGGYGPAVYILLGVMVITLASYLFYEKRKQIA